MRAYVTAAEYTAATNGVATDWQIKRASLAVDDALIGALYDTDVNNLPTDEDVLTALKEATIAQALAIVQAETVKTAKTASIGSASYTFETAPATGLGLPDGGGLCEDARRILKAANLFTAVTLYG